MQRGDRVAIDVAQLEFVVGGRTIWVQGEAGTVLRIQLPRGTKIEARQCAQSGTCSHADLTIQSLVSDHPASFCLGDDVRF